MKNHNRKFLRLTCMCAVLIDIWVTDSIAYEPLDDGCKSYHADFKYNNHNQHIDGDGDVCDPDTSYGTISGAIQKGVTVYVYELNCGIDATVAETITDPEGYFAIGDLPSGRYILYWEETGYSFAPKGYWADIPNEPGQSYDFTAIED